MPGEEDDRDFLGGLGVAGVRVGHWTDLEAQTGCTVIELPEGTVVQPVVMPTK